MGGGIMPRGDTDAEEEDHPFYRELDGLQVPAGGEGSPSVQHLRSSSQDLESGGKIFSNPVSSTIGEGYPMAVSVNSSPWTGEGMDLAELEPPEQSNDMTNADHEQAFRHSEALQFLQAEGGVDAAIVDNVRNWSQSQREEGVLGTGDVTTRKGDVSGLDRQVVTRVTPVTRVFKLMEIRHDNQDLSVVEKVIFSEDKIVSLCNSLASNSAKTADGQNLINFARLDAASKTTVGFYGSKGVMIELFHRLGMASEDSIWRQMTSDTLSPGLYVWLRGESAFVFYWHEGHSLPFASQRSMSCNFVRYIVDLCDRVCVCIDGGDMKESFFTNTQKFSKKQRTQRLKIAVVKASENSISVSPGFSTIPNSLVWEKNPRDFKWTEGSSRVALLVAFPRQPKISTSTNTERIGREEFPSTVASWENKYSLDLSKLSDPDLLVFLEVAKWKQFEDYKDLQVSYKRKMEEWKKKKYGIDEVKHAEEEKLHKLLAACINICLEIEFPAEHMLFSADHSSAEKREREERMSILAALETEVVLVPPKLASLEKNRKLLRELENEIHEVIFGKNTTKRLVYPGAEVSVRDLLSGKNTERTVCKLESETGKTNSMRPFRYGMNVILEVKGKCFNGKLHNFLDRKSDGLVVNDRSAYVELSSGRKIRLEFTPTCSDGLESWLRIEAQSPVIKDLYRRACLLTSVLPNVNVAPAANCRGNMVQILLESKDILEKLQPILTKNSYDAAESFWIGCEDRKNSSEAFWREDFEISDDLRKICVELYSTHHDKVVWSIWSGALKYCQMLLAEKLKSMVDEEFDALGASKEREEREYLWKVKKEHSRKSEDTLTFWIESCKLVQKGGGSGFLQTFTDRLFKDRSVSGIDEVSVTFTQHEREAESITWKAYELAPLKGDLEKMHSDPEYILNPSCSGGKDLIDLDPAMEKLHRVFFLRGGQVLVFIEDTKGGKSQCHMYLSQKIGVNLSTVNPIRSIKRGYEILCFDERSRFIAFYEERVSIIKVFRFDDTFRHMDWTGADIHLSEYSVGRVQWMDFVTGRNEIAFIDENNRVRVCEVSQPAMVRPGNVHLGSTPFVKALFSTRDSCLLVLRLVPKPAPPSTTCEIHEELDLSIEGSHTKGGLNHPPRMVEQDVTLIMDVYKFGDSIVLVDSVNLELAEDAVNFQFAVVSFESQQHLTFHNRLSPRLITSKVLKIVSAADICQVQSVRTTTREEERQDSETAQGSENSPGPVLDYIPQVFDKYATCPALAGDQTRILNLLLIARKSTMSVSPTGSYPLEEKCLRYMESSVDRLRKDKGKDFTALEIRTAFHDVTKVEDMDAVARELCSTELNYGSRVTVGSWILRLICLVPIQIARAENNSLQPMVDGLQLSTSADFVDAISLANVIRFGLYETVINQWVGPIKVISSMGKQSSGKSYLLNHLSGSLLDVAGGRCTDGVWMTVRECDGCLYVLLDFEGLGSFERSEQEDMLLSILNAAISNLTIFNKKDFHLDKETEAIFQRFQNGVSLVNADSKLFKGLFYMAIKDVDSSDVEDLKKEFFSKITQICSKSQDNFLTKMYGGSVEISAMPFFNRPEFHESIRDIGLTVEEIEPSYLNGKSFLRDMKLIISQITTKDWSSIDSKRVALRINLLREHLKFACSLGCFYSDGCQPLVSFDDQKQIADRQLEFEGVKFCVPDFQLELTPCKSSRDIDDVLDHITGQFKPNFPRTGTNDEMWHLLLEKFIADLVDRRKQRILEWLNENMADFPNDGDSQKLKLEAMSVLAEMQQKLLLCSCKCGRCFLRCVQEKGHPSNHSCKGDHRCEQFCTYCQEPADGSVDEKVGVCGDVAGHDGPHACVGKTHTCGKCCIFAASSSNCNGSCSEKSGHEGDHRCNSRQHNCKEICSLPACKNPCVHPVDGGEHDRYGIHACHEKVCPEQCTMDGCNRTCAAKDHFHSQKAGVTHHFCGSEHPCPKLCEHEGNCQVDTGVSRTTKTFKGKRSTFDYELVSEQTGNRKGCCLSIPPFREKHDGPHSHTNDPNTVHFCETRCHSCGYFCIREFGHGGLHRTNHGNMRDVKFAAESEEINLLDRKYSWGETGVAELCNMHCKAQGRGHIHLIRCPATVTTGGVCRKTFDGARHETCRYGPDFDNPKDELTHSAYWEYTRFEDPCSIDERKEFDLCNHRCKSDEHEPPSGVTPSAVTVAQYASYCTEPLWHDHVAKGDSRFGTGYITEDGHHFTCDHSKNVSCNVIFIIDRSGSMQLSDIRPTMTKFVSDRLGCVYEAITRFIRTRLATLQEDVVSVVLFNGTAQTVVELETLKESVVDRLLIHEADGCTTYSSGLLEAEKILKCATQNAVLASKWPTIIFLSDGGNNGGNDPLRHVRQMKAMDPRLKVHTIMFGTDPDHKILQDMASVGDGSFEVSLDEVQLSRRFEGLAVSLKTKVASLI